MFQKKVLECKQKCSNISYELITQIENLNEAIIDLQKSDISQGNSFVHFRIYSKQDICFPFFPIKINFGDKQTK